MALLKYYDNNGNWIGLYADAIRNRLRCDKNLSDVYDIKEARKNLELVGDNNHTHFHDDRYNPLIIAERDAREEKDQELDKKLEEEVDERIAEDLKIKKIIMKIKNELTPVGTIMAWAVANGPQPDRESTKKLVGADGFKTLLDDVVWLECDGRSCAGYPLEKILGSKNVPNFQGMFLRGHGSQYVQDDKERKKIKQTNSDASNNTFKPVTVSKVNHISGDLGVPQYDTVRNYFGYFGHQQFAEIIAGKSPTFGNSINVMTKGKGNPFYLSRLGADRPSPGYSAIAISLDNIDGTTNSAPEDLYDSDYNIDKKPFGFKKMADLTWQKNEGKVSEPGGWYNAISYIMDKANENFKKVKGCSVIKAIPGDKLPRGNAAHCDISFHLDDVVPTSEEVRPANIAVKFFIRAQ